MPQSTYRRFGNTSLKLSPLGLGCWQFSNGGGLIGKFWPTLEPSIINDIVRTCIEGGINWFDTAEIYGNGQSEQQLARALRETLPAEAHVHVATKWWPILRTASSIGRTINDRSEALEGRKIDLYQVHQPFSFSTVGSEMREMIKLAEAGKIEYIGVSNFCAKQMIEADRVLREHGMRLASNQVKYSLLDRSIEKNGILDTAKELNAAIIAYSPLAQGILSGKFHDDPLLVKTIKGPRKFGTAFRREGMKRSKPLIDTMRQIASHYDATVTQVALNWLIHAHGNTVFAIPGASKAQHAEQNVKTLRFKLTVDEINEISEVSKFVIR
ncbi:aldo/keto reductase [Paenibacillus harenae]|uniref:aldo/keto reductase n=1 Tax=Paenibacillus harenae TaxID=306543 RepID=UPI0027908474|nr:aldo/keto reductase [Paenibacillus harenae]MDQ0062261.1 aryl-alcohol dehydrogenase-like predicted oxidoreductase [Paenibacillus harenae]